MKIIATEEHFVTEEILRLWRGLPKKDQDPSWALFPNDGEVAKRLLDLSSDRLRLMDECGVDVQVLSLTTPGTQNLEAGAANDAARRVNDIIAETVRGCPDRFQGFATIPTPVPSAAARELERGITQLGLVGAMMFGRTRDRNADHVDFEPIYEAAASLGIPLYFHPQTPQRPILDTYYSGLGNPLDLHFATGGIGWHYETGIQIIRMILSGVFDRYPNLQVITGHWGEAVLFYLDRIDLMSGAAKKLKQPVSKYFSTNLYVTPSGVFSQRYLRWAIEVIGLERILFSTDYPYQFAPNGDARAFLMNSGLSIEDIAKVAHGNWDQLLSRLISPSLPNPRRQVSS